MSVTSAEEQRLIDRALEEFEASQRAQNALGDHEVIVDLARRMIALEKGVPKNALKLKPKDGHHHMEPIRMLENGTDRGFGFEIDVVGGSVTRGTDLENRKFTLNAGGLGFCHDILVMDCWTGTEGFEQTIPNSSCSFFVYSTMQAGIDKAISGFVNANSNVSIWVCPGVYNEQMDFTAATAGFDINIHGAGWDRTVIGAGNSAHLLDSSPTIHWYNLTLSAQTGQVTFSGTCTGMRFEHCHFLRSMAGSISGATFMDCDFERGWIAQAGDSNDIDNITIIGGSISGGTGEGFDFETNSIGIRNWNVIGFSLVSVNSHFTFEAVAASYFQVRHGATGNYKELFTFSGNVDGMTIAASSPIHVASDESLIIAKTGTVVEGLKVILSTGAPTGHTANTRIVEGQGTAIFRACHFDMSTYVSASGQYFKDGNAANVFEGIAENCKFTVTPPQELIKTLSGSTGNIIDSGTIASGSEGIIADPVVDANFYNGTFVETFSADVTEAGGVVTMALAQAGGGDLTMRFSDGLTILDTTPAVTIALTVGSDTSPQVNYVYIPQSTKVLTKSTSQWPTTEHIKVAFFFVPSAAFVQANGLYIEQQWNDHHAGTNNQGHMSHLSERERLTAARYFSGIDPNGTTSYLTIVGTTVDYKSTSGVIYQMHAHASPAVDTSAGDELLVVNWAGVEGAFHNITNLFDIVEDSGGNTIGNNKWFNLVIWGVANKEGTYEPDMINLPAGFYNTQASAEQDISGFDNFDIPREFDLDSSTGFPIVRLTVQKQAGTWAFGAAVDLRRGDILGARGGASSPETEFPDNTFNIFDATDNTKVFEFQADQITTGNTRTLTVPDGDGTLLLSEGLAGGQTFNGDTASGGDLILHSTSDPTKGNVFIGDADGFNYDEENVRLSIGGSGQTLTVGGTTFNARMSTHLADATVANYRAGGHSNTSAIAPNMYFNRSRGTEATPTVVVDGNRLGIIQFGGFDGTDYETAATIMVNVDGTVADGQVPGRIVFSVADSAGTLGEAMRIDSKGDVIIPAGTNFAIGASSISTIANISEPSFQVLGTDEAGSVVVAARFKNDSSSPSIRFFKSRAASVQEPPGVIVQDNDVLGGYQWYADDGVDYLTHVATCNVEVDDAAPGVGDIGAAFVWSQTAAGVALRETLRFPAEGGLQMPEQAALTGGGAGTGNLWVKSTTPSTLIFTDDTGADTTLGAGGGGSQTPWAQNIDGAGFTLTGVGGLTVDGEVVFNEASADVDFRVESDNLDDALFVQGSNGFVGIGTQGPFANLDIRGVSGAATSLRLRNDGAVALSVIFDTDRTGAGEDIANFDGRWNQTTVARIAFTTGADTVNKDDGFFRFSNFIGGVGAELARFGTTTTHDVVVNNSENDQDFRVAASAISSAFLVVGSDGGVFMAALRQDATPADGDLALDGDEVVEVASSALLKDNIRSLDLDPNLILAMTPRSYEGKGTTKTGHGFIAEEMAADVSSQLVTLERIVDNQAEIDVWKAALDAYTQGRGPDPGTPPETLFRRGGPTGLRWREITTLLVAQVQEQAARIAELEAVA